jgi:1-acyl-sn-glycerol-3-phosphate acyltransferase
MKSLGGYPVDRSKRLKFVDQIIELFNTHNEFSVAIAPEGTRRKVEKFKTGFYYIARGAGVPIILVKFDYANRVVHFNPEPFYPGDNAEEDLEYIWNYYKGVKGKNAEDGIS